MTEQARPVAAMIGVGVIGAGWAARFLLMGWDVRLFDPAPDAARKLGVVLEQARRALPGLSDRSLPSQGAPSWHETMSQAVCGAVWIQESVPERLALKRKVHQKIQESCARAAIIASSTSGLSAAQIQGCATRPGQIIVVHPCDPVYLLPLAELGYGAQNAPNFVKKAEEVLTQIGMYPLHLRDECAPAISARLFLALWREAAILVRDEVATTDEIDTVLRHGIGLTLAQMGLFGSGRFVNPDVDANASAGANVAAMHDFSALSNPPLPVSPDAVLPAFASDAEPRCDAPLVAMLRALKAQGAGAGAMLNSWDASRATSVPDITHPIPTGARTVPLDWTDYNGHMNEARYLQAFGDATDSFMALIGCDAEYIASGGSYFTVETHIRHLSEVRAGVCIRVETVCVLGAGKKMHLFHQMYDGARLLATGEHMLVHVSLKARRACPPAPEIAERLRVIAKAHAALPRLEGIGRAIRGGVSGDGAARAAKTGRPIP